MINTLLIILEAAPKTVATLLYIACGGLISAVVYLYINHRKEMKEKDDAIMTVMKEHRDDIKESNQDYKSVVDKFATFMKQIEAIINAKKY